jgi:hypothetical protein
LIVQPEGLHCEAKLDWFDGDKNVQPEGLHCEALQVFSQGIGVNN